MANPAANRVKREFKTVMSGEDNPECPIKLEIINDNWTHLRGEITGPLGTPYEKGTFELELIVPETYPFNPPKVRFITKMWHPNISSVTGAICMDILKTTWAAGLTLRAVLISLQLLLSCPEPDDPQDAIVAGQYKTSYDTFVLTAKHWTNIYAGGPHAVQECNEKVQRLKRNGVDEHVARIVLSKANWRIDVATKECQESVTKMDISE